MEKRKLGEILKSEGKITDEQLEEALRAQRVLGKKLGEVLVANGLVSEEEIIDSIESQTGIKKVNLNTVNFDRKAISLIPQNLCVKYNLIPFGFNNGKIKVALADPLNIFAIDDVTIVTGFEIETFITTKGDIKKFIGINYSNQQVANAARQLLKEQSDIKESEDTKKLEELDDVKNAPVVKMVDSMFKNAIDMKASDIHIEPFEDEIRIRYRIDGKLQTINTLSLSSLGPLVTRIKILAGLNIAEKRIPQDGRIMINTGNIGHVDLRVSVLPVVYGEKVVIRVLNTNGGNISKTKLGLNKFDMEKLDRIIKNPHGIILVTGPTGSGKSTTLYAVLQELNTSEVNIVTVEDPVEYTLEGINQVNVNVKAGLTFAGGLRSILRQDPDIIMIGEIRDSETAEIAIKAAITGHLVLSTLHTNDAPSSIARLEDMEIKPYLVATSVVGIIAQRLVRKVCPHCRQKYAASEYEKKILGKNKEEEVYLYKGRGCPYCNNTGYSGRIGVYEIMEMTREIRDAINAGKNADVIRDMAVKNKMKTLGEECRELVLDGRTTIDELTRIVMMKE